MKNFGSLRHGIAALLFFAASSGFLCAQETMSGPWVMQVSGTTAALRGIHAVGGGVAWASGTNGTILRTEDSGYMWQSCAMPPGAEKLDFRGIWAWDENTAMVMSSGPGGLSRIYKTTDGCSHWKLLFTNPDKDGFWDAMEFWDKEYGYILGDPVDGSFVLLSTIDGGKTWEREDEGSLKVGPGEAAFAASNSSLWMDAVDPSYFGTGGSAGAFVRFTRPDDKGPMYKWFRSTVPLASGNDSSGVFSLAFRVARYPNEGQPWKPGVLNSGVLQRGIAVGGDYKKPNESAGTAAWTSDGGKHWTAAEKPPHGYRSAVAWDADVKAWIAVGTNGSDVSYDDGKTWIPLDDGNWNALSLPWVVGPKGRIAKLDSGKLPPRK
ncbi:MAG: hypothetical protein WA634_13235 [Silvibacterium sp.]